jgi:hypothetical protein
MNAPSLLVCVTFALLLAGCGSTTNGTASCPSESILANDVTQLNQDIGRPVTVDGTVVSTHFAAGAEGSPTYLDFHNPYQGYFKVVIWVESRRAFSWAPEDYYVHRHVCVTGTLSSYDGPEIRVTSPGQIAVI